MINFEGIQSRDHTLTRATMPKEVFSELIHHEELYPDFQAYNYTKSCTTPEDCVYVITGSDIVGDTRTSKKAQLTITYRKERTAPKYTVSSTFNYIDESNNSESIIEKIAA